MTLIKLRKVWGTGLFLQRQQLITVLGVNGEFASGIARDRFGSRLRILQTPGTRDPSGLPFHHGRSIEVGYQSGAVRPHSKGSAISCG